MRGNDERPIVVGGCHRSGTSLLRRILDTHSRIHCGPEVLFFRDFYGEYTEDPLRHLRFATTARALLPEPELFELLGRSFVALHTRAAASAGKPRWADKAPENVLHVADWDLLLGEEWLLLHVARNPLDTLASMHTAPFPLTLPTDNAGRIAFYRRYTEAGLAFGASRPDRYRIVIYEELAQSPEQTVAALMAWLGELFEPAQLAFNEVAHQQGLEDPKIATTSGVHSEGVGRWTEILSTAEAELIWAQTSDLWLRIDPNLSYVKPPGTSSTVT